MWPTNGECELMVMIFIGKLIKTAKRWLALPVLAGVLGFAIALQFQRGDGPASFSREVPSLKCPHCGALQASAILTKPADLHCKLCGKITYLFRTSDTGTLEHPSWFLQGFIPSGVTRLTRGQSTDKALVNVWFSLFRKISYRQKTGDVWQRAARTWQKKAGDCEDHAFLLTDSLRSLGYDARTVAGKYKGQGHAWVVVKFKGKEYLLDQLGRRSARFPPRASLLFAEYRPAYAFDEKNLHIPSKTGEVPADYWNSKQWDRIPTPDL
jgi:predicted transglutaminase-like cysteine proteinase